MEFLLSEAFIALRRNTWMTFAAVTTVAMALYLLGGIGYGFLKINSFLGGLERNFSVRVFLKDHTTDAQIKETERKIKGMEGVKEVTFISKERAFKEFRLENPEMVLDDLENPLPDMFQVSLENIKDAPAIGPKIQVISTVEENNGVVYSGEYKSFLETMMRQVNVVGLVLGIVMLVTGGILIYNAIRLTILARRREIAIMQLVGATRGTVWGPLMIEGVVQGSIGGVLASLFLWSTLLILARYMPQLAVTQRFDVLPYSTVLMYLLPAGAVYGFVCSMLAVREPRRMMI
jgi:cell division transport system permease protein